MATCPGCHRFGVLYSGMLMAPGSEILKFQVVEEVLVVEVGEWQSVPGDEQVADLLT